jgi:tRNA threonylcarbamoyladenosine biosynthesis protein TsaE
VQYDLLIESGEAMKDLGERLALNLRTGDVLLLHGDLGAGKTTLVQGIARAFNVPAEVQSPTFTLVAEHQGMTPGGEPVRLYHLDLYRLEDPSELESFGYESYLDPEDGISLIEWPERAEELLPERFILVRIDYGTEDGREVRIEIHGDDARYLDGIAG